MPSTQLQVWARDEPDFIKPLPAKAARFELRLKVAQSAEAVLYLNALNSISPQSRREHQEELMSWEKGSLKSPQCGHPNDSSLGLLGKYLGKISALIFPKRFPNMSFSAPLVSHLLIHFFETCALCFLKE